MGEDVLDLAQYNSVYGLNSEGNGYPVLRMNEFDMLFAGNPTQYSDKFSQEDFLVHSLKKDDVLICRTNGNPNLVGKSALVARNYEHVYESHLFKVRPKKELITSATLVTYLNTSYGRLEINKLSMQGNQANFSIAKFKELKLPKFSVELNHQIDKNVFNAFDFLEQSKLKYAQAEQTLLEAVGLADFKPSTQNTNIKTFAQSFGASGRLDAEYYQPKYEVFESTVKSNKNGFTLVKNEYDHFNSVSRKPKAAYHYIEISDVNVSDGTNSPIFIETSELPANAKFEVIKGDLIISKVRPNRGAITVIESELDNLIVSGAFTVLREKPSSVFTKEVLKVLLRTPVYREWMLQFNVGTQYPVIRDEDILDLPIPKIDLATQTNISQLVQQSFSLKAQSEHLLSVAKHAVEMAIEQDEAAAMHFIENSTN